MGKYRKYIVCGALAILNSHVGRYGCTDCKVTRSQEAEDRWVSIGSIYFADGA